MRFCLTVFFIFFSQISHAGMAEVLAYEHVCDELTKLYPEVMYCLLIPRPMVVYTTLVRYKDRASCVTDGLYVDDEPFIFVYPKLRDRLRVVVHEMTHYVMYEAGVDKGMDICERERVARLVAGHRWTKVEKATYKCK